MSQHQFKVLDLSKTNNNFIDESILLREIIEESNFIKIARKISPHSSQLRSDLGGFLNVDPEWVFVGAGSSQIIDALLCFYSDYEIIDVLPNFHMARTSSRKMKLTYHPVIIRHTHQLITELKSRNLPSRALLIFSSPRNPLGCSFTVNEIQEILEYFSGPVLIDQAYVDYSSIDLIPLLKKYSNLVLIRTFSKAWGIASLRVGYAISSSLSMRFNTEYLIPYNVCELSQRVASQLIKKCSLINDSVQSTIIARQRFLNRLQEYEDIKTWSSDANYICFEFPDAKKLHRILAKSNILVKFLHDLPNYPNMWPAGLRVATSPLDIENCFWKVFDDNYAVM